MADNQTTDCRRRDGLNVLSLKLFRDGATKLFRFARMLQYQRALQIDGAMQTAAQNKVTFQQRPGLAKLLNDLF